MKMKRHEIKHLLLIIICLFSIKATMAQTGDIEGEPNSGGTGVPIDGGIVTITLIAAAYGAKRRQERKDKED
jgi:hypothetical protein